MQVSLAGGGDGWSSSVKKSLASFGSLDSGGGDSSTQCGSGGAAPKAWRETPFERLQALGVLRALLQLRDWKTASELMEVVEGIEIASYPQLADAMCDLVDFATLPAYEPSSPLRDLLGCSFKPSGAAAAAAKAAGETSNVLQPLSGAHEALRVAFPVLKMLGLGLNRRPLLFSRLCRLCIAALEPTSSEHTAEHGGVTRELVEGCVQEALLPALVCSGTNPGLVHELWKLLESLPYTARYKAYGVMHARLAEGSVPELAKARATTADDTKRMMRRLSKENTKQYGRHLGKLTHCNPSVVFDTILGQIQAYDNLIVPVVDMMKYLTPMSFDVLSYMLLVHLSSNKTRLKDDGLSISLWMQSLSSFCGNLYKKYTAIELVGLLQYITNTLKSGQSLQMLVLRDLVTKMAGIDTLEDLSADQLDAQAGGETLRNCVIDLLGVAKNTKKSSTRLKEALQKHSLMVPLFMLIAQQRSACIFLNDTHHLKMLGEIYDRCQDTLEQFQTFAGQNVTPVEYAAMLPTVGELCATYQLEPEVAFFIARPALHLIKTKNINVKEGAKQGGAKEDAPTEQSIVESQRLRDVLPAETWEVLSPQLYATFWSLSLYDIYLPRERYQAEMHRLTRQIQDIERWVPSIGGEPDPRAAATKRKKDKERCQVKRPADP